MRVQDRLRSFLIDDLGCGMSNESLTDTYALIDHKVVDSVGIYQLVAFIEIDAQRLRPYRQQVEITVNGRSLYRTPDLSS